MIRMNPMHDTKNPPGQAKKLSDVINNVLKSEARIVGSGRSSVAPAPRPTVVERLKALRGPFLGDGINQNILISEVLEAFDEQYANGWRDASAKYGVW